MTDSLFSSVVLSVDLSAANAVGLQQRIVDMLIDPFCQAVFCKEVFVMISFRYTQPLRNLINDIFWAYLEFSSFSSP